MTAAERTYRLALQAYPAAYRAERGPEILATLDEMRAGRRRPEARQVLSLIAGGIRAREADRRLVRRSVSSLSTNDS